MSYPVTLKDLSLRVRQRSNLEGAIALYPDSEIADCINATIPEWYDEVRGSTWGGQYYRSSFSFNTVASSSATPQRYPLPPDFLSMLSVDVALGGNTVISARPFQEEQRNAFRGVYPLAGWQSGTAVMYGLWGQDIAFIPGASGVFPVTLNYTPTAPRLFRPTDALDSINGFEEFVVLGAAIKALLKDGQLELIGVLQSLQEAQRQRIRQMAPRRDQSAAERVHEIDGFNYDY